MHISNRGRERNLFVLNRHVYFLLQIAFADPNCERTGYIVESKYNQCLPSKAALFKCRQRVSTAMSDSEGMQYPFSNLRGIHRSLKEKT